MLLHELISKWMQGLCLSYVEELASDGVGCMMHLTVTIAIQDP